MRIVRLTGITALAVLCVAAMGCSSNNKGKIEGTKWSCIDQPIQGGRLTAGLMTLEFKADGGFIMVAGPTTITGKYSLGTGDTVTLDLDQPLEGQKKHAEKVKISGNQLEMIDSDGKSIKFSKVS